MPGFDEYYNIKEFPEGFLDELEKLNTDLKKKFSQWKDIEVIKNHWPEGNAIRINYCDLPLNDISEIDIELQKLFQKYSIAFEMNLS